ncbi:MAG TPA: hypothetical protein PK340_04700 [Bacilli bacterium]|nr:hypothetical protein [Bacilli bacterium]
MTLIDGVILTFVIVIIGLLIWYLASVKTSGGACASCSARSSKRFSSKKNQSRMVDAYRETYHKSRL